MRGGWNASLIINEMKREEYYKKRAKRNKCMENGKLKCDYCADREICQGENIEEQNSLK